MITTLQKKELLDMYKREFLYRFREAEDIDETRRDQAWGRDRVEWDDGNTHLTINHIDRNNVLLTEETHDDRFGHYKSTTEINLKRTYDKKQFWNIKEKEENDNAPTNRVSLTLEEEYN